MNFKRKYSKITVLMAVLHGVVIGVAAVAIVGFILIGTGDKGKEKQAAVSKEVPASGPPAQTGETLQLFAKQHGVFSTAESATAFIAERPALAKLDVIKVQDQYYVWSAVGLTDQEIDANAALETFRKPFTVDVGACTSSGAGKLKEILMETDSQKIKDLAASSSTNPSGGIGAEFAKNIAAVTAFTDDLQVIRLKLLSHYSHTDGCAKISF
ncbi:hypothetical protein [Sporosarcina sp. Te-1]|uniref:hypothetical protein n=1 Tax=Sporosarcina sp. Te-1 TaxID=2818390 RepID=UPI001A9DF8E2|nr:hypothetical protein [Sporosarcina sp. Te-1]QTD41581.1 hypothetical protein J3U78_01585 [Sporosarcina sp. Te-1]